MSVESKILLEEQVDNKQRKFGSNLVYYPAKIVYKDGKEEEALFTLHQLNTAVERAARNPEDMPKEHANLWNWLFK